MNDRRTEKCIVHANIRAIFTHLRGVRDKLGSLEYITFSLLCVLTKTVLSNSALSYRQYRLHAP